MSSVSPHPNAVNLSAYWTWMGEDGIVRTKVKAQAEVTLKEAQENSEVVNSFFKQTKKKYPLLIDSRHIKSISKEARDHFSIRNRETGITSFAVLIDSPLSRIIGNFFMGLNKPSVPAKLFTNEAEAVAWLKQYL
ncbi:MAG: STAS/SEC14 domain-containing protein [Bacteroidia bacterium]